MNWSARITPLLTGLVRGVSVVALGATWGVAHIAGLNIPDWVKVVLCVFIVGPILAVTWRAIRGGEEGPMSMTMTPDRFHLENIPQSAVPDILQRAIRAFAASRRPLPPHAGRVKGNPADQASLFAETVPADAAGKEHDASEGGGQIP